MVEDLYPFINAMKAHNIKLVSFLSLMGVENNSKPPHYKIEKYIEELDIPYAHIYKNTDYTIEELAKDNVK